MNYDNSWLKRHVPRFVKEAVKRRRRKARLETDGSKENYSCPVCSYEGPFLSDPDISVRHAAICPECGAQERHRLQSLVLNQLFERPDFPTGAILHFAPEPFFSNRLSKRFARYETADYFDVSQDHVVDISALPFPDESYDLLYASHVLEHVQEDVRALKEIERVLRPGGVAILPVPVMAEETVEYPEPSETEFFHVRAPGVDYFDRYRSVFGKVELFSSDDFSERHQVHILEDRSVFPTELCPLRKPQDGERHLEFVPVCHRSG